ncbi:MAG: hypothetical protein HY907_02055 [Deltaproteobacteria bacterium]|nr:hypothetical protein [Deltaproteobacteria bacterium]
MTTFLHSLARTLRDRPMYLGILAETAFVLALAGGGLLICTLLALG